MPFGVSSLKCVCYPGKCGVPKAVANARIVYENSHGNKLRYACLENFKRKAGTSSLIVCEQDAITRKYRWSPPQLVCIYLAVEDTTESHTTRETARPTQIQCTNPGRVPAHLYGSQTTSPVLETSSFAPPPRGTAKPSSDSLGSTVTATSGDGWMTTGTVSKSVTPSPTRTPFSPDENINTQWTPQQTTSAPSEGPLGNTTDPTDTGIWQSIAGSHYFKIGIPFFAVILSAGFVYYCYCARSRAANLVRALNLLSSRSAPWRQARVPSVEVIPMDPLGSEEGRSASAGEAPDPGPANEEDPMLTGLPPPVE
ncbi:interleukin-15 receptor subunit alpha [Crotalus adamanteus]|uniref:Interleukin-15 receptor subunit alpha n=1 Tax=Crotalus adamanteus TaxID=8729 RepID=A0AAW1BDB3_CROAD